jgi:twitching motility protein PilT
MRQIDKLVGHLIRFAGEALVVASGAPVTVQTTAGEKTSNQVLDHASVTSMITEVAPPGCLQELRSGKVTRFIYGSTAMNSVTVEVAPAQGTWTVTFIPGASPGLPRSAVLPEGMPAGGTPSVPVPGDAAIEAMLRAMALRGASDLHLSSGVAPMLRLNGEMQRADESPALSSDALRSLLWPIVPKRNREEFERRHDTDFAHEMPGVSRFRVNLFMDRNGIGAVFRRIPFEILSADRLGLAPQVLELCDLSRGLVLVTGPTGSGKSTTLASLIDRVNATRDDHIVTIEDPVEFVHNDKRCLVRQREVGVHTEGFRTALRAALREDPDVVLVGEMRDLETVEIAIETAETGHLVFGTLHTNTAASTVDRIIDQFPPDRQSQIRAMLSDSLKGVIAQTLCRKVGGGRVAAYEVLIGTPAVANLIREGKTFQLPGTMQTSKHLGMITMADALLDLVLRGLVEPREAYLKAINKTEIRQLFHNAGVTIPDA